MMMMMMMMMISNSANIVQYHNAHEICHVTLPYYILSLTKKAEHELYTIHHRLTSVYCCWSLNHYSVEALVHLSDKHRAHAKGSE